MSQSQFSGAVQSAEGEPLPFVNVLLVSTADSTLVKGEISGDDGTFVLTDLTASDYRLLFSMVGYAEQYSDIFQLSKGQRLTLEPYERSCCTLSRRHFVAVQGARRAQCGTLQPTSNAAQRQNGKTWVCKHFVHKALEPFVLLEDVALLDAVTITARKPLFEQKIELITTPPSSFDAEGNAGFINIYGDYTHYRDARFLQSECESLKLLRSRSLRMRYKRARPIPKHPFF